MISSGRRASKWVNKYFPCVPFCHPPESGHAMNSPVSRRSALKLTVAGAAGTVALPHLLHADEHPAAAATIGQRTDHHRLHRQREPGQDVDGPGSFARAHRCRRRLLSQTGQRRRAEKKAKWTIYQDYRKMLEKEKLDAVVIATPDHARARSPFSPVRPARTCTRKSR